VANNHYRPLVIIAIRPLYGKLINESSMTASRLRISKCNRLDRGVTLPTVTFLYAEKLPLATSSFWPVIVRQPSRMATALM
jgi:hypothetical protein